MCSRAARNGRPPAMWRLALPSYLLQPAYLRPLPATERLMRPFTYLVMTLLSAFPAVIEASPVPPQAEISNASLQVKLYLPDAEHGFYRGTRFDWSGVVADLQYKGHSYYGPWFTATDPKIPDFIYQGSDIVAGPCSAITGPVEEFTPAVGFDEAKPGATFLKVGVGILRKPDDAAYSAYRLYEIVDGGKWSVKKSADAVEFTQELHNAASGYGYVYQKKLRLLAGKPVMVIEHSLKNTGTLAIHTSVYDHNFLVLDKQPTDAGFNITFPFAVTVDPPPDKELAEVVKNQILYRKTLTGEDRVYFAIAGFGKSSDDYKLHIENSNVHAGMTITGDRPLAKLSLWSIRSVIAVEPFIDISVEPGGHSTWKYEYEYYTLPQ
jgi:hypothetical protein